MKKFVYTVFVIFWSSVATIAVLHFLSVSEPTEVDPENGKRLPIYTLSEVAEHDSLESCWMAIEGKVYDFTDYIPDHPTEPSVMEEWCGREATEGMRTKGYGRDHSRRAWAMMEDYLIGILEEQ